MKIFSRSLFALVASTFVVGSVGQDCGPRGTNKQTCEADGLCTLTSGNPKTCVKRACSDRNNENQCESDGICIWDGKANGASCIDLSGTQALGENCTVMLMEKGNTDYWVPANDAGCAPGLTCSLDGSYPGLTPDMTVNGKCESEQCSGKKNPTNCNGGSNANQAGCSQATERVTICHRTCSRKNPWVRITIDNDAWNGTGCGHQLQHDVTIDCANQEPWTEWGVNRKDYLIKYHGTRAEVSARLNNVALEKAYWRMWEPACPYVRNGACCNWDITDPNDPNYNLCCGEGASCDNDMTVPGSDYCQPGNQGVILASVVGGASPLPGGTDPLDMVYNIASVDDGKAVSFKVQSPYSSEDLTMYVEYHKPAPQGGWDKVCDSRDTSECSSTQDALEAACLQGDGQPFTLIQLYFVDKSGNTPFSGGAALEECCIRGGNSPLPTSAVVAQYSFILRCECPPMPKRRLGKVDQMIDIEKVLSAFSVWN